MIQVIRAATGISGETDGFRVGGFGDDSAERFPFAAPFTTATTVGTAIGLGSCTQASGWESG